METLPLLAFFPVRDFINWRAPWRAFLKASRNASHKGNLKGKIDDK